MFAKS